MPDGQLCHRLFFWFSGISKCFGIMTKASCPKNGESPLPIFYSCFQQISSEKV